MKKAARSALICGMALLAPALQAQDEPRQFDFWLGSWNVYLTGTDSLVASSEITLAAGDLAIREVYQARSGFEGESLSKFNQGTGKWEQFWVDNSGQTFFLTGAFADGGMVLEGESIGPKGPYLNRVTWHNLPDGPRQVHEISSDGGKTWKAVFDGTYARKD